MNIKYPQVPSCSYTNACTIFLLASMCILFVGVVSTSAMGPKPKKKFSTDLQAWFQADTGLRTQAGSVSVWDDQSGNDNHATQATASNQPRVNDNSLNFNPTVGFNGTTDILTVSNAIPTTPRTSIFIVARHNAQSTDAAQYRPLLSGTTFSDEFDTGYYAISVDPQRALQLVPPSDMRNLDYAVAGDSRSTDTTELISVLNNNNTFSGFSNGTGIGTMIPYYAGGQSAVYDIGGSSNTVVDDFAHNYTGDIAEIIYYNSHIDSDTKTIESYLALKYGITLDAVRQDYTNSTGDVVYSLSEGYNNHIVGIARDNTTTLDQRVSKSIVDGSILTLSTDTDFVSANSAPRRQLKNRQYLVMGSNGESVSLQSTELDTNRYTDRIQREWYAKNTRSIKNTHLQFDGFGETYVLLVDADGDFSTGSSSLGSLDANGTITATIADGMYYTLATNTPATIAFSALTSTRAIDIATVVTNLPQVFVIPVDSTTVDFDLSDTVFTGSSSLTVRLTADTGTWTASTTTDVQVFATLLGSGETALVLTGTPANLNTYLDNKQAIQYRTDRPTNITITGDDGSGAEVLGYASVLAHSDMFITTWNVSADNLSITIPTIGAGYSYHVDCNGDGVIDFTRQTTDVTCQYPAAGEYTVHIFGDFPRIYFNNTGSALNISDINQWGTYQWSSFADAFYGAANMQVTATDVPNLSADNIVASGMFRNAGRANPVTTAWDTSNLIDMSYMFAGATLADPDVSRWDVSGVTNMSYMFDAATTADPDINLWQTDSLENITSMFSNATLADPDLSGWNISRITNANAMLVNSGISTTNYDRLLVGWSRQNLLTANSVLFNAAGLTYCNATARAAMIQAGWLIDADTMLDASACGPTVSGLPTRITTTTTNNRLDLSGATFAAPTTAEVVVTLSADAGTLTATSRDGVIANSVSADTLTLRGTVTNINNYLDIQPALIQLDTSGPSHIMVTAQQATLDESYSASLGLIVVTPESHFFITTWRTTIADETITIPIVGDGYDYTIDCGNGTVLDRQSSGAICTYPTPGEHVIRISGTFPQIHFNFGGDKDKILEINQWGTIAWRSFINAFPGTSNLTITATDIPDLSGVQNMRGMFANVAFNNETIGDVDVSRWDTSGVTDMRYMFRFSPAIDFDISGWDMSAVTEADNMLEGSGFSSTNYDKLLNLWSRQDLISGVNFGAQGRMYCNAAFRAALVQAGWTPMGDAPTTACGPDLSRIPSTIPLQRDVDINFNLSRSVFSGLADVDVTFTISADKGTFSLVSTLGGLSDFDYVNLSGIDTGEFAVTGTISELNDFFSQPYTVTYRTSDSSVIRLTISDPFYTRILGDVHVTDPSDYFVSTWRTTTPDEIVVIPIHPDYEYRYGLDCDSNGFDDTFDASTRVECYFATPGDHTITIGGTFPAIYLNNGIYKDNLIAINQWGTYPWATFENAFFGASNVSVLATDMPNLSAENMSFENMFFASSADPNVRDWDVSTVTNMTGMFRSASLDPDVSLWDTGQVTRTSAMFANATLADPDVSRWNTENLTDIGVMFFEAPQANPDLSGWNISNITNAQNIFFYESGLTTANYDKLMRGWSAQGAPARDIVSFGAYGLTYCDTTARAAMVQLGWTMTGDSLAEQCNGLPTVTGLPTDITVVADQNSSLDLSSSVFADGDNEELTVTLAATTGMFTAIQGTNITATVSPSGTAVTLLGTPDNINAYLDNTDVIQYNTSAISTLTITIADSTNTPVVAPSIQTNFGTDFITTWQVDGTIDETITIPTHPDRLPLSTDIYDYDYRVDCGNGTILENQTDDAVCSYTATGNATDSYTVTISGTFPAIYFNNTGDKDKITNINQWGTGQWQSFNKAFYGTSQMTVDARDVPDLSVATNLSSMFESALLANPDTNAWNTGNITNMSSMFAGAIAANPDVSQWDTSVLGDTQNMFLDVTADPDVSRWDVSAIVLAQGMFDGSQLSRNNYDALLENWSTQDLIAGVTLGVDGIIYCNETARTVLRSEPASWIIVGDRLSPRCISVSRLDIDGSGGSPQASTDGILIARYIASVRGESLIAGAVAGAAQRTTSQEITDYLDSLDLDIDGNGGTQASTDGILIARYIASVRGESLVAGAIAGGAPRDTADLIGGQLDLLNLSLVLID